MPGTLYMLQRPPFSLMPLPSLQKGRELGRQLSAPGPMEQETPLDSDGLEPASGEKGTSLCGGVSFSEILL